MEIEKIIYDTTRECLNLQDKLSIATVFLFCQKFNQKKFAELLYTKNHQRFVYDLNIEFKNFGVDFSIRFEDRNVSSAFYKTLIKVIEKEDSNGYLKALHENDEFALVIYEILNVKFDSYEFMGFMHRVGHQLKLNL